MELLDEIKQLKSAEGTKHTIVDTSTKKELNIEIKDTSVIRKSKRVAFNMLMLMFVLIIVMIVSLALGAILKAEASERALGLFSITLVISIIFGFICVISTTEDNLDCGAKLALINYKKLQKLLEQADFKDEIFINIKCYDNTTSGQVEIKYFDKNNNKEFKNITFKFDDTHYEKDLKTPKLIINTAEESGVQLCLPIDKCKNYMKLKEKAH